MATAVKALQDLSQDPEARWMARDREDSAHFYRMGLERSRQQGRTEGFVEGRTEGFVEGRTGGFVEGRTEIQKETVAKLCAAFGIELTEAQRSSLDDPKTDLDEIIDVLIRERRWPWVRRCSEVKRAKFCQPHSCSSLVTVRSALRPSMIRHASRDGETLARPRELSLPRDSARAQCDEPVTVRLMGASSRTATASTVFMARLAMSVALAGCAAQTTAESTTGAPCDDPSCESDSDCVTGDCAPSGPPASSGAVARDPACTGCDRESCTGGTLIQVSDECCRCYFGTPFAFSTSGDPSVPFYERTESIGTTDIVIDVESESYALFTSCNNQTPHPFLKVFDSHGRPVWPWPVFAECPAELVIPVGDETIPWNGETWPSTFVDAGEYFALVCAQAPEAGPVECASASFRYPDDASVTVRLPPVPEEQGHFDCGAFQCISGVHWCDGNHCRGLPLECRDEPCDCFPEGNLYQTNTNDASMDTEVVSCELDERGSVFITAAVR